MPHFQLVVPNYDQSGSGSGPPLTYIRLGAAWDAGETLSASERADGLLTADAETLTFKDDGRYDSGRTKPAKTYYRDDGHTVTTSTPSALSNQLLTRGGVREHTDGNRVSTTRGDCVEVVGGNYKLVIMGRVEGSNVGRSYWESSGGHNHDSTSTPGEVYQISWTASHEDGTWQVTEQTLKGEQHAHYYGRKESQFYGPVLQSYVGQGSTIRAADKPDIKEHTYCRGIDALEVYDSKTDTTNVSGNVTENTNVSSRNREALYYKRGNTDTVTDTTGTSAKTGGTPIRKFSSHLIAPLMTSQSAFAAHYEKTGGDFTTKFIVGTELNVAVGAATTFRYLHMGVGVNVAYSFGCTIAASVEASVGLWANLACMYKEEAKFVSEATCDVIGEIGAAIVARKLDILNNQIAAAHMRTHASADAV